METVLGNPRMVVSSRSSPAQAWKRSNLECKSTPEKHIIQIHSVIQPLPSSPPCLPSPFAVFEFVSTPRRLEGTPVRLPIKFWYHSSKQYTDFTSSSGWSFFQTPFSKAYQKHQHLSDSSARVILLSCLNGDLKLGDESKGMKRPRDGDKKGNLQTTSNKIKITWTKIFNDQLTVRKLNSS